MSKQTVIKVDWAQRCNFQLVAPTLCYNEKDAPLQLKVAIMHIGCYNPMHAVMLKRYHYTSQRCS